MNHAERVKDLAGDYAHWGLPGDATGVKNAKN